jgi:hypothetical protein
MSEIAIQEQIHRMGWTEWDQQDESVLENQVH